MLHLQKGMFLQIFSLRLQKVKHSHVEMHQRYNISSTCQSQTLTSRTKIMMGRGCWWNEMKCELYIEMQSQLQDASNRMLSDMLLICMYVRCLAKQSVLALKNVFKRIHNNFMPIENNWRKETKRSNMTENDHNGRMCTYESKFCS